ncbi:DUF938 domain-containing protein [Magnetospira sp. QH-2]|uniref:DUF938 domain-containing protein n=1 Tax=Magnetospira sp. (strain QH-2) TaxID=1288970 RepID=UPI0003E81B4B|nr:DUF938 domain-containing protein [Magnetospira sp. QH-2]CCQ75537.1 conserved protein of unknown function [Magnetospira sp. QH-2]
MKTPSDANDPRRYSPSTARNREPILAAIRDILPAQGLVLEIAAGSGEHGPFIADALPDLTWQPSDLDPDNLPSIAAWAETAAHKNVRPPLILDVMADPWPIDRAGAILCINMIHISPWACTEALMRGAGSILAEGAPLILYGPYRIDGKQTAPSNEAFEGWLKGLNPDFGVRDLGEVAHVATRHGLTLEQRIEMPANNFVVVFRRG